MSPRANGEQKQISATEAALYDRQLRLWGISAQTALMNSHICVVRLTAIHVECLKNVILAGVGKVTIVDPQPVTAYDLGYNYFLREEDIGKPRGQCTAARMQQLNPHVKVVCEDELPGVANSDFTVVIMPLSHNNWDVSKLIELDHQCRKKGASFFVTAAAGEDAWFFAQAGEYTVKEFTPKPTANDDDDTPNFPVHVKFPSLQDCVQGDLSKSKLRKRPAACIMFMLLLKFRAAAAPSGSEDQDKLKFCHFAADLVKTLPPKNAAELTPEELQKFFSLSLHEPLVITGACLSGIMAQEVMKSITKRDVPLVNTGTFARDMLQELLVPHSETAVVLQKPKISSENNNQNSLDMEKKRSHRGPRPYPRRGSYGTGLMLTSIQ